MISGDEGRTNVFKRRRPSYANAMATIAVFVALGGTSYAALTITGRDVQDGSLTKKDLKRNTLDGSRIRETRLGKVPRARRADRVGGVTARELRVRCPDDTTPVSTVCVEKSARLPVAYRSAAVVCEGMDRRTGPGRRLPTHDELMTAFGDDGIALAEGGELTRNVYPSASSPGRVDVLYVTDAVGNVGLTPDTGAGAKAFRCVASPLN